ncbi:hypothetical protein TURU_081673 [Turdus rufiventris]|nr:hypothetical protein TURU_081673 [Turdus rufiventris]
MPCTLALLKLPASENSTENRDTNGNRDDAADIDPAPETMDAAPEPDPAPEPTSERNHPKWVGVLVKEICEMGQMMEYLSPAEKILAAYEGVQAASEVISTEAQLLLAPRLPVLEWMFKGKIPFTHHDTNATWSKWVALITQRTCMETRITLGFWR